MSVTFSTPRCKSWFGFLPIPFTAISDISNPTVKSHRGNAVSVMKSPGHNYIHVVTANYVGCSRSCQLCLAFSMLWYCDVKRENIKFAPSRIVDAVIHYRVLVVTCKFIPHVEKGLTTHRFRFWTAVELKHEKHLPCLYM